MKKIRISLIIVSIIVVFGIISCILDYNLAKNDKKPIFSHQNYEFEGYTVQDIENEKEMVEATAKVYSGFGYKIVKCSFCEKNVYLMILGSNNYPFERLTCNEDMRTKINYDFLDGKLEDIIILETIPEKDLKEEYRKEVEDLQKIEGCSSELKMNKNSNGYITYDIYRSCKLSLMSEDDIEKVFKNKQDILKLGLKQIKKKYQNDNKSCNLF
ncbi:MAG: hypothetical protein GX265_05165 [Mollicutes bacterium]|nr:hypothetical protein [Mollicutes bacterium]